MIIILPSLFFIPYFSSISIMEHILSLSLDPLFNLIYYFLLSLLTFSFASHFHLSPILLSLIASKVVIETINIQLVNGLFKIHPIFYSFFMLGTFFSLIIFISDKLKVFSYSNSINKCLLIIPLLMVLSGAIWAQQELNWGGWWYWDPVEVINLVYLLLFFYILHFRVSLKMFLSLLVLLFVQTLVVRYNLVPTIHSFLISSTQISFSCYLPPIIFFIFIHVLFIGRFLNFSIWFILIPLIYVLVFFIISNLIKLPLFNQSINIYFVIFISILLLFFSNFKRFSMYLFFIPNTFIGTRFHIRLHFSVNLFIILSYLVTLNNFFSITYLPGLTNQHINT